MADEHTTKQGSDEGREPRRPARFTVEIQTDGNNAVLDLTPAVRDRLRRIPDARHGGVLHLFVVGSTAALSTMEYEPGLVNHDLKRTFEALASETAPYEHESTWNDDNGHSHIRATLLGPDLSVPFGDGGDLLLGTWQQIVLVDFDTRPRLRTIVCTAIC